MVVIITIIIVYYIKGKFCISVWTFKTRKLYKFCWRAKEAVVGFEPKHLDGCDLLVCCLSPLGYAGLTNEELELLLAVVICFIFL